MAVPKKKSSKSRRNMRRYSSSNRLETVTVMSCSACHEPKRPHTVCRCGSYDGKQVLPAPQTAVHA